MDATVLGMDPLTFTLTALSALGVLCSTAAFLARRYGRWRWCYFRDRDLDLWLASAEGMDRVWEAFERLCGIVVEAQCEGGPTGTCAGRGVHGKHLVRLRWHVERLEYQLKTLMLATTPRSTTTSTTSESPAKGGIVQTLRRWFKTIAFLRLSQEIRAFALSLRMITKQMERVKYARLGLGMGRDDGLETSTTDADDLSALEAAVEAAIESLLASLPAPKENTADSSQSWKAIRIHDLEANVNNYAPSTDIILPMIQKPPRLHLSAVRKLSCSVQ
ncbi:hypothetical protein JR316_0004329 [Psilocybe cubensis]|uniref:Uncharacterized protein n=2 Tax=Psilocybe cubensis TaxID=181762 RepID=A0ACB8H408_PSICU|nr:hypothetical protein JR316_0004329 [Psilocybe cubensis]KAH9482231.1 hypothetical protein JR316_0004329 [Psilocybe cubensis]